MAEKNTDKAPENITFNYGKDDGDPSDSCNSFSDQVAAD
jgi:hypothetical protein